MGFADLHIHSIHSHDGTSSISAILKYVADQTDLSVIAITDHDTISGVREAVQLAPKYGIEVVPGCEVSTADGHLLTLYITEQVPAGLSLSETVCRVGQQGGLCIVPHPEARGTSSVSGETLWAAYLQPEVRRIMVGVETFNGGLVYTRGNLSAVSIAAKIDIAHVGNSDSHILQTIGEGSTEFAGTTAIDLRSALYARSTTTRIGKGLQGPQALRHWLPTFILRKLGWVVWNENPEAPLQYVRMKTAFSRLSAD
jgi:predicted metal-dependent phosphoesterase TrpH